ncbi:MAG TPA: response regulator transcription factor [Deinococcales bacterium]|nr:response regulator transcription factor [Deinococcales bacterium]
MAEAQTVLIIEDDTDIAHVVRYELEDAGYRVLSAADGVTGLTTAREANPDLVILDLGLPDLDGAEIARRIRKTSDIPIIVLTAMDAIDRKVSLLDAGADDYLTKPFHPEELLARVRVQLRHHQGGETVVLGDLEINAEKRICKYAEREVRLSPREFDLLTFLARQPGRVYTREEIERGVWGEDLPSNSNVVDVHMANIRAKLRDVDGYGVIRTVRGIGYALKGQ